MVVLTVATTTAFARLKEDEEEEYEHDEDEEEEKKQHDRLINSAMMFWRDWKVKKKANNE